MLSTGELLITGGHDGTSFVGLRDSWLFKASADTSHQWTKKGSMNYGRWYPSNVTRADGLSAEVFAGGRFLHAVIFGGTEQPTDPVSATHNDACNVRSSGAFPRRKMRLW